MPTTFYDRKEERRNILKFEELMSFELILSYRIM
jgi:hypothetical protein